MSQLELNTWVAYVDENGPLNLALRFESAVARVAAPFLKKGTKARDLMPWPRLPEPEATPESLVMMFRNLSTKTKQARKN